MRRFQWRGLTGKLMVFFLLAALAPTAIVGALAYYKARVDLEQAALDKLYDVRQVRTTEVVAFWEHVLHKLEFLAGTRRVSAAIALLSAAEDKTADSATAKAPTADTKGLGIYSEDSAKTAAGMDGFAGRFLGINSTDQGFYDILLVNKAGRVVYTYRKLDDQGADLSTGDLAETGPAELWRKIVETEKPAIVDFAVYPPAGEPAAFAGVPVFNDGNEFIGLIAARLGNDHLQRLFEVVNRRGKTEEAYIVGPDFTLRTELRLDPDSKILVTRVDTEATRSGAQDKSGTGVIIDYRRVPVLSSWAPAKLDERESLGAGFDWTVVTEIDRAEAFAPVYSLARSVLVIAVIVTAITIIVALLLSRSIAKPILLLTDRVGKASEGNLNVDLNVGRRNDELGELADSVRRLLNDLREQAKKSSSAAQVLASSVSEISATASQLSASTSKTSSAVTETTTTVEEVKQAAKLSSEQAKTVSHSSVKAVEISYAGRKATDETVHRMKEIRQQMSSVGETVVKLSEQSKAIEEIISSVQDLADQSNLLAVNASIEAARAGDQGKGFAVVAHEIKSLADQSKEATEQIRGILGEIRQWVNAVVMATEQGGKAVEAGVEQSVQAGDSIQALADSVAEAAHAATVIDTSSEQQFIGVEQVAGAMTSIETAMQQNLAGTSQLEDAARRLEELGHTLKELMDRYTL